MEEEITVDRPATQPLTELRSLAQQEGAQCGPQLRAGTDRLIIEAMRRIEGTPGARRAAAEAATACRALVEGIEDSAHLHNAATADALAQAREAAIGAIDRLEGQLATCPLPADADKSRRRAFSRSSSVVMKKRRPMVSPPPAKAAAS